jgi:hypothetical protein
MGRKIQVCALSLIGAFGYSASASAQVPADAPNTTAPAAATVPPTVPTEPKTEPDVTGAANAPAAPPIAHEPTPMPVAPPPDAPAPTAFESLKIESKNGSASLKLGLLLQPQFETIGSDSAANEGNSNNLFVRRTRVLIGGTLFKTIEYFFETDSTNLFKSDATGAKTGFGVNVQDAFMTWKAYEDMVKFDVGYMLTPGAHNALQGAGTLLGLDYFSNSFNHSTVFNNLGGNPAGRDAGAEVRGLLLDNHIEYRAGLFQGLRRAPVAAMPPDNGEVASQNMFRFAGRLQINLLDAETGFFYAGTYLGKKKVASVGAALDMQSDYVHWAVDGFLDMPAGPGGVTAQVNFSKWNGGGFTNPPLPNHTAIMAEAGYRFDAFPIAPIVKFEQANIADSDAANTRIGGGVAWFPYAHNVNLKAFFTNINAKPPMGDSHSYNQFQLQGQLYFY